MSAEKGFLGEFGSAVMQIAEEKGIARDKVIGVVEAAIAAAYKKEYGKRGQNIRAIFNEKDGSVQFTPISRFTRVHTCAWLPPCSVKMRISPASESRWASDISSSQLRRWAGGCSCAESSPT